MAYKDKEKQKECHRRYYEANREKVLEQIKARNRENRRKAKEFIHNYLSSHPCVDCGEEDIIVLEFDHVRGNKVGDVKKMMFSHSIASIQEEINKCEIRCANCHRRVTHKRRNMNKDKTTGDKITPVEALR